MHVLVVNDDGPPSQLSSPYVHSFIHELQSSGVTVSVVLPHTQRSWIGKAHIAGRGITPTYFRPGTLHTDDGTTHTRPRTDGGEEWVLIDGTPASCTQIGLNHYFHEKGPIDLVVSGPNYGRNSTALFSLSSGTVGGAMEGAVCGRKSIALSYGFHNRNHDPVIIRGASLISVRLVKYLYENWAPGVDLYSVNVPLIEGINEPGTKVLYTNILQNYWTLGSSFEEVEVEDEVNADMREMEIREKGEGEGGEMLGKTLGLKHKKFMWAPKFADIHRSVDESEPGNDGWAVKMGHVSVTPLKANFMHSQELIGGEINLEPPREVDSKVSPCYAIVDYDDPYVRPRILSALQRIPNLRVISSASAAPPGAKLLYWCSYEKIDFESVLARPESVLSCSYIIRKALIRKHYLSTTIAHHIAKHPNSILKTSSATTCELELDYAEYLDEALSEAYELRDSLADNENKPPESQQWWILKPGMSDRGQGIRLFSTLSQLEHIFLEFEGSSESEPESEPKDTPPTTTIITSQLRHFVAQTYIHPPLLISSRKFHIRTYVLSSGALRVYVYRPMLALFAETAYNPPWENTDPSRHLTNTCLQPSPRDGSIRRFWDLGDSIPGGEPALESIFEQIRGIVAETWEAAARGMRVHFQTLRNAFEVFGVDFLVSGEGVYLLEVNAYPDFRQTGEELAGVVEGLFGGVVDVAVRGFMDGREGEGEGMVKVLDVELGSW